VSKGETTREAIIEHALRRMSVVGLEGISIGGLASSLNLSKSGLFAHFGSKEKLALEAIRSAVERFLEQVFVSAVKKPRGEPRVRALFENWLNWAESQERPGGCVFVQLAAELDDQPGPVRDALVQTQRDFQSMLAEAARIAVREGHFRADLEPEQFAFEMYALMLGYHHNHRLLADPNATKRVRSAFESLLTRVRT
jgi:AcrR family transcriptional regulator